MQTPSISYLLPPIKKKHEDLGQKHETSISFLHEIAKQNEKEYEGRTKMKERNGIQNLYTVAQAIDTVAKEEHHSLPRRHRTSSEPMIQKQPFLPLCMKSILHEETEESEEEQEKELEPTEEESILRKRNYFLHDLLNPAEETTTDYRQARPLRSTSDVTCLSTMKAEHAKKKLKCEVTNILNNWMMEHLAHPYPTKQEKEQLCALTGLDLRQLHNWLANNRRRKYRFSTPFQRHYFYTPSEISIRKQLLETRGLFRPIAPKMTSPEVMIRQQIMNLSRGIPPPDTMIHPEIVVQQQIKDLNLQPRKFPRHP